jgi:AcrR family transcriptional regulator
MPARSRGGETHTADRILEAALVCFAERGIAATGMEDIARAAELTRQALYYHFTGKRELVLAVLGLRVRQTHEQLGAELAGTAPTAELIVAANVRAIELARADGIALELAAPENEHITAELLRSPSVAGIHRAFWLPILDAATDAQAIRDDLDADDLINWMIYLQFSIIALGGNFGFNTNESISATLNAYLLPALRP